ncbi:MAG: B12-binding domain-containing radical SAM protein [Promethearchaeota archaeon]|nr:MAG: B12-binding domain-containing radical SAM protein [Candidatus Lokiarchaeota archaeon]
MKINLINAAPSKIKDGQFETLFYASAPPLGLLYLATYLKDKGHKISILDQAAVNYENSDVIDWVKKADPDVVGFSVICASIDNTKIISKTLKSWNPNLKIIFGNYLSTFYARKILENYDWVDICVRGDGEMIFSELIEKIELNNDFNEVDGITYKYNSKIRENQNRRLLKNLDILPFPDRKLIPNIYKNRIGGIDVSPRKFTTMVSSRGCPFGCNFCACTAFSQGVWRTRSVNNIFEEICELSNQGFQEILFVDDNFTLNMKRIVELCNKIMKEKLDMVFVCDGRVNNSSINLLRTMKKAKFEIIMFGLESSSQRMLDFYNKRITPQMSKTAVKNARKAGFKMIVGSFMIGGFDETYTEAINTLRFISKLDIDFPHIIFTRALPGTQLFNSMIQKNIIDENQYWERGVDLIDLPGAKMKRDVIFKIIKEQFHLNFFRPKYLVKALLRTLTSKYRQEMFSSHLNFRDIDKFIKLINNPPDLF